MEKEVIVSLKDNKVLGTTYCPLCGRNFTREVPYYTIDDEVYVYANMLILELCNRCSQKEYITLVGNNCTEHTTWSSATPTES